MTFEFADIASRVSLGPHIFVSTKYGPETRAQGSYSGHIWLPFPENVPEKADRDQYELLCRDNTRKPVDEYKDCHLGRIPSHAVVARSVGGKNDLIRELLNYAQVLPSTHFPLAKGPSLDLGPFLPFLFFSVSLYGFETEGISASLNSCCTDKLLDLCVPDHRGHHA